MPREIEYRCWDKIKKEWVLKDIYFGIDGRILEKEYQGFLEPTDIFEVSQWTGLRDSKGVKVFEGDVVGKIRNDKIISYKIIKFDDFEETFYTDNFNSIAASEIYVGTCYYRGFNISKEEVCESIVMGNIYQNPELLEVKND